MESPTFLQLTATVTSPRHGRQQAGGPPWAVPLSLPVPVVAVALVLPVAALQHAHDLAFAADVRHALDLLPPPPTSQSHVGTQPTR